MMKIGSSFGKNPLLSVTIYQHFWIEYRKSKATGGFNGISNMVCTFLLIAAGKPYAHVRHDQHRAAEQIAKRGKAGNEFINRDFAEPDFNQQSADYFVR